MWASGHATAPHRPDIWLQPTRAIAAASALRDGGRPHMGSRFCGNECVREDALSARCESVPEPVAGSVIEGNCVAARRGGEQPEVSRQSVEPAPAEAGDDEPASA